MDFFCRFPLGKTGNSLYDMCHQLNIRMTHSGKCGDTAEGVTLSGVRKDEDRMSTELWRRPPRAGAEGASVNTPNSQAKGQRPSIF